MAIKLVERRICDFCDDQAGAGPCLLCHKDFCFDHGGNYRQGDLQAKRPRFDFCDECANDLKAKLAQANLPAVPGDEEPRQRGGGNHRRLPWLKSR